MYIVQQYPDGFVVSSGRNSQLAFLMSPTFYENRKSPRKFISQITDKEKLCAAVVTPWKRQSHQFSFEKERKKKA